MPSTGPRTSSVPSQVSTQALTSSSRLPSQISTQPSSSWPGQPRPDSPPPPYPSRFRDTVQAVSGSRPSGYIRRAVVAAWFPLRGVWYFCRNASFWSLFVGRLMPLSIISFLVYFTLFAVAFLPQYAFLAVFHGWGAWINAVVLVLAEGLVVIQLLFEGFFVDECRVDVFDATLLDHGLAYLVAPHRVLYPQSQNPVKCLGKPTSPAVFQPWSLIQIIELVIFVPLNLIPYVGTPAFILITGSRLGRLCHHRYYFLQGLTKSEKMTEIKKRQWDYLWFGSTAMILELVPVLSFFFLLTTAAGTGLWTARLEREAGRLGDASQRGGGPPGHVADSASQGSRGTVPLLPAEYQDDPV